jgi:hypothetical protein
MPAPRKLVALLFLVAVPAAATTPLARPGEAPVTSFPDGSGVYIFDLDTGMTPSPWGVPAESIVENRSFLPTPQDCGVLSHGSLTGGIIANPSFGKAPGVRLISYQVGGCDDVSVREDAVLAALQETLRKIQGGMRPAVVLLEFAGAGETPAAEEALYQALHSAGVPIVGAAGNNGGDSCQNTPSRSPEVFTAGGLTVDQSAIWQNSATGACVSIWAQAQGVLARSEPGGFNTTGNGTSSSAALTASAMALAIQELAGAPLADLMQFVLQNARWGALPPGPKVGPHNAILDFTTLRTATTAPCDPSDPTNLCLGLGGRFKVQVLWTAQGQSGKGEALGLTSDTGGFWFFSPTNIEMLVKVLDGCALGGHFWFFAAGLTNVDVAITVTDLSTHTVRQYESRAGSAFQPIQDTATFACN